jgi:phenylacetate-CoA ligase
VSRARELLACRIVQPGYLVSRLARPAHRAAAMEYVRGLRFRAAAREWSGERKERWVLERLRFTVRRAYRETEYYRELLDGIGFDPASDFGFAEYARLPVLEREDVAEAGGRLRSGAIPARLLRHDSTGGSTGEPTHIWMGPEERGWRESGIQSFMRRIGVPKGSMVALLWGHHLDPVGSDRLSDRLRSLAQNTVWLDCLRLSPEVLGEYHARMQAYRPTCLIAYAGALGALAEVVAAGGEPPRYPTRCFVTGAEKLLPKHRRLIEEVYQRPVYERYGSRDIGIMGFQMEGTDYEVDWPNLLIEPDGTDRDASILVTKLHADGMPMLRYRVGDLGRFPDGSRPGHPAFTLHEVLGRAGDRIWLPDGRWVHAITFPHLMKDYPVQEFQVFQSPDYSVTISVVAGAGFGESDRSGIRDTVEKNLKGIPVGVRLVDEIPRTRANKWRPVISEVVTNASD